MDRRKVKTEEMDYLIKKFKSKWKRMMKLVKQKSERRDMRDASKKDQYLRQRTYTAEARVEVSNVPSPQVVGNNDTRAGRENKEGRQKGNAKVGYWDWIPDPESQLVPVSQ